MTERHTKGTLVNWAPDSATGDTRTAMGRASDNRPPKYYVAAERADRQEPPEVTEARERYRAHTAAIEAAHAAALERYQAAQDRDRTQGDTP